MHQFPPFPELEFLIGKELQGISLAYWSFSFSFDHDVGIVVEGDLEHVDKWGTVHKHNADENRLEPLFVHHLLGHTVRQVAVEPFCLTLTFDHGDKLRILSDDGPYECGQIYGDKSRLIVF